MDTNVDVPAGDPSSDAAPLRSRGRLRVSHACDRCKKRKIRCTGTQPCNICIKDAASCTYAAARHSRGRKPRAAAPDILLRIDNSQPRRAGSESVSESRSNIEATYQPSLGAFADGFRATDTTFRETPSRASPEPIRDLQGHYVGPASGVSFLARVRKRLQHSDNISFTFTFGDAPLAEYDPVPSVMLSTQEASCLFDKFFDFTVPIDRILHRPTTEQWLREFQDTMGSMRDPDSAPGRRAVIWMIFAMAQEHMDPNATNDDTSIRYFLAADYQLSKERGTVSLASVQARLYQCFWLLSRSRMNHCWGLFGTAARLALALGLHRKQSSSLDGSYSLIDLDCSRRTFWSAYCLDNHLSLTLGRPRIFHDEDIDQELPSGADDGELSIDALEPQGTRGWSIMLAPLAYYKLHRILSKILSELYSIRNIPEADQHALADQYSRQLSEWRGNIPAFLQATSEDCLPLIPIFQRQRDVLNLSYWHAVILTYRPLLLKNFTKAPSEGMEFATDAHESGIKVNSIRECLDAALCIVARVCQMFRSGLMFRSFWGTCYYGFSAATVLYVYSIQASSPTQAYQRFLDAAIQFQGQLSNFTGNGSLVARYCLILEELRLEALRHIEGLPSPATTFSGNMPAGTTDALAADYNHILGVRVPYSSAGLEEMNSVSADYAPWMQFGSMAVPSFTGFDPLARSM